MPRLLDRNDYLPATDNLQFDPAWLAGMLEIAGTMVIEVSRRTNLQGTSFRVVPQISLVDKASRIIRLQGIVGGTAREDHHNPHSWRWRAYGKRAAQLALQIRPYALFRSETIDAFYRCEHATSLEKKLEIVKASRQGRKEHVVEQSKYDPLVTNPSFLAGILDARAFIIEGRYEYPLHGLTVTSINRSLLTTLSDTYGGHLSKPFSRGETVMFPRGEHTMKRESLTWHVGKKDFETLTSIVQGYIRLLDLNEVQE